MGQWRYLADGGEYVVDEVELRNIIKNGKLPGDARVKNIDENRWYRVDVDFYQEFREAEFKASKKALLERKSRQGLFSRYRKFIIPILAIGAAGYYWWTSRLTCSSEDVTRLAASIVKDKLLKLTGQNVRLLNVATINSLDSGGSRCSADAEISSPDASGEATFRRLEYSFEKQGDQVQVIARLTW